MQRQSNPIENGKLTDNNQLLLISGFKVRNDSCTVHDDFKQEIITCYDRYASTIEDQAPFGLMNGTA